MDALYDKNCIRTFEIKILASGEADAFLPMSFMEESEKLKVTYFTEDYMKMTECSYENPFFMLDIIEKVLIVVKAAENRLIPWYRYMLTVDTVFLKGSYSMNNPVNTEIKKTNRGCGIRDEIKICFVPKNNEGRNDSLNSCFTGFIESMKCDNERCTEYAEKIRNKIKAENPSYMSVLTYIGELKREAFICGWADR